MADKEIVIKEKLSSSGLFDFKSFYSYAHTWFRNEKYGVVEENYGEKMAGNAKEIFFVWMCTKKLSDYFKIEIEIKAFINDLTDVEVEIDGQRKKSNKGKILLDIEGVLSKDPNSTWEKSAINQFMRDIYDKYVIPGRIYNMQMRVRKDVATFKDEMKAFLEVSGRR